MQSCGEGEPTARAELCPAGILDASTSTAVNRSISAIGASSVSRPSASDFVRGAAMPIWATTWAPCHVSVWMSIWRANGPPVVPTDMTATGSPEPTIQSRACLIVPAIAPAYPGR